MFFPGRVMGWQLKCKRACLFQSMKPFGYYKINLSMEKFKDAMKVEGRRKHSAECMCLE